MRRDDQINQALQMYVLLLRNKQLFTGGIAHKLTARSLFASACSCTCVLVRCNLECTIFIIINLLNSFYCIRAYHTQHPELNMYVKRTRI